MGLYLCVFSGDVELNGVDVGHYSDFARFRTLVSELLEGGNVGAVYPTLIRHSDCDGEWSPDECRLLKRELAQIRDRFRALPAIPFPADWQREVVALLNLQPATLLEAVIDVDGEPLVDRLMELCDVAIEYETPILFQ